MNRKIDIKYVYDCTVNIQFSNESSPNYEPWDSISFTLLPILFSTDWFQSFTPCSINPVPLFCPSPHPLIYLYHNILWLSYISVFSCYTWTSSVIKNYSCSQLWQCMPLIPAKAGKVQDNWDYRKTQPLKNKTNTKIISNTQPKNNKTKH